ncbi:hypothetical protein [Alphaproteobacteria bacterium endosymbiont of Tiliacea citrago]|uniref:hypothetical protein n=1 Tax=Alphaproteobacteria bacterium endosymbiont of Tiliacea citrago TaxID=3077944 RepID=UPI00313CC7AC
MSKYNDILDELQNQNVLESYDKEWLIKVQTSSSCLTSGQLSSFSSYCGLNDYYEEIDLVTGQDSGVKGICVSNVKVSLLRNESSVKILKSFKDNYIFSSIELIKIMKINGSYKTISRITFATCKITNFKIFLDKMDFYFKYSDRSETYTVVDSKGATTGSC